MNTTAHRRATITFPDLEIRISRQFDAPHEFVHDASTTPEHMRKWWAPGVQHALVRCEVVLRLGGGYRFVLRDEEGQEVGFLGEYLELTRPKRIVQSLIYEPYPDHGAVEYVIFEEVDGGTLPTTFINHKSKEDRDGMLHAGMEDGMNISHARLDDPLSSLQH